MYVDVKRYLPPVLTSSSAASSMGAVHSGEAFGQASPTWKPAGVGGFDCLAKLG